jgi:hypothetical protein
MTTSQSVVPGTSLIGVCPRGKRLHSYALALESILAQTFTDFEVIVGNDYVAQPLSAEYLGIYDDRIRYVNHARNMGEIENNNALVHETHARYFTWQTQDDIYHPSFLEEIVALLSGPDPVPCVFTSYALIKEDEQLSDLDVGAMSHGSILTGRDFIRRYFRGDIRALGCTGVYDRDLLKSFGGVQQLSETHYAVYSEHLLLIQAGTLDRVGYVPADLVGYRIHQRSWGVTNREPHLYRHAGRGYLKAALSLCSTDRLKDDFESNIRAVLVQIAYDVFRKSRAQNQWTGRFRVLPYFRSLRTVFNSLDDPDLRARAERAWIHGRGRIIRWIFTEIDVRAFLGLRRAGKSEGA